MREKKKSEDRIQNPKDSRPLEGSKVDLTKEDKITKKSHSGENRNPENFEKF